MQCYQKSLTIPYTNHVTNDEVFESDDRTELCSTESSLRLQTQVLQSHITSHQSRKVTTPKPMLEKRREKRQRKHRLDNLTELTELKLHTAAASTVGRGPQCLFEGLFVKLPTLAKRVQYVDWTRLDI